MKKIVLIILLTLGLSAKSITTNDVYSQVMLITDEVHFLLNHYGIEHDHESIIKRTHISTKVKPRNTWQITYEIMIKINILRERHNLVSVEPINIVPVLELNPELVYEQTQRILTELKIFKTRENIITPPFKEKTYKGKTPLDVFVGLTHVSAGFDELNGGVFTPSYVFAEQMRLYDDITLLLEHLHINDTTIPKVKKVGATPEDVFDDSMKVLEKIKHLQISAGLEFVDFSAFKKGNETPAEVYTITQMIISELQNIKAYVGIKTITRAAAKYNTKTPAEVGQLVSWNLRKLNLIHSLSKGR